MSRIHKQGVNPKTGNIVDVAYGWDEVPRFKPGYFFQVYSRERKDLEKNDEGIILNEGFINGISEEKLKSLLKEWTVK